MPDGFFKVGPTLQRLVGHLCAGLGMLFLLFAVLLIYSAISSFANAEVENIWVTGIWIFLVCVLGILLIIAGNRILDELKN